MKVHDVTRPASNPFRTICEIHRQIYKAIQENRPKKEIIKLLQEAYRAGKRMDKRLREYKKDYDEGFWKKNE